MQYKKTLVRLLFIFLPAYTFSQTTYLPQGDKANILLDRLEIKGQTDSVLNFSKTRPFSRKQVVPRAIYLDSIMSLSKVDKHNLHSLKLNNLEWVPGDRTPYLSKKPILKAFYKTPANLFEVNVKDFFLAVNPVFQYTVSKESDNDQHLFLNTRGVSIRGRIADKIGFYSYITDNQERDPLYVQAFEDSFKAVPGAGFYKDFKTDGYDYFDARGYFTFNVTKYIDVVFGYDKNFIGNGHRSLLMSDFSNSALFLKLNTRIWKLNYQNLFLELNSSHIPGGDQLAPKKYAAMHHLDMSVTKWLNIGLFEGVVFGREDHFEFGYLNPIIFYRSIEQQNGSFDNALIGIDAKANVAKKFQFYTQLMIDEFLLSEIKAGDGWWANKWAIQLGGKYIDAFGIKNLDLQLEHNRARPFTYSHRDSVANYSHYNQPLAHPLGANFSEIVGIARYQPAPRWFTQVKLIAYKQGLDSSFRSFGSNVLRPNTIEYRETDYGFEIGSGHLTNVFFASFLVSYEFRENLFFELYGQTRQIDYKTPPVSSMNSSVITIGVRWNMHRREFDF